MIESKNTLGGNINSKQESLNCDLNVAIEYIPPSTQEKAVLPTNTIQEITPDKDYTGLSKVTINAIPTEETTVNLDFGSNETINIKPSTNKFLTNVSIEKDVNLDPTNIKKDVEIFGVTGVLAGEDINEYFETTITSKNRNYFYSNCIKQFPILNVETTSLLNLFAGSGFSVAPLLSGEGKVTNWGYAFSSTNIEEFPQYDTSSGTNMSYAFYSSRLITLPLLDFSSATNINHVVNSYNENFINCGGFLNLGNNYSASQNANYFNYKLNLESCNNLTHDSLMNIINNLYDIKTKGCNVQQLVIGSTNLAKLTAEEIAIATNKGWNVS